MVASAESDQLITIFKVNLVDRLTFHFQVVVFGS